MQRDRASRSDLPEHHRHGPGAAIAASIQAGAAWAGGALPLAVLLALVASVLCAVCVGELASRLPPSGSVATYASRGLHPWAGFLMGWGYNIAAALIAPLVLVQFGFTVAATLHPSGPRIPQTCGGHGRALARRSSSPPASWASRRPGVQASARLGSVLGAFAITVYTSAAHRGITGVLAGSAARASWRAGKTTEEEYRRALEAEIDRVVDLQGELGLDVLVHGEPERNDMVRYFAASIRGFVLPEAGWVQSCGSRCVRPPILFGDVARPEPLTVTWTAYAATRTTRPLKAMLTGPGVPSTWRGRRAPFASPARPPCRPRRCTPTCATPSWPTWWTCSPSSTSMWRPSRRRARPRPSSRALANMVAAARQVRAELVGETRQRGSAEGAARGTLGDAGRP